MAKDDIEPEFGNRVRTLRKQRGLSQEDLAHKIARSTETVSNIERGITFPRPATIVAIADALEVGIAEFFGDPAPAKREHPLVEQIVSLVAGCDSEELQAVLDQARILLKISSRRR